MKNTNRAILTTLLCLMTALLLSYTTACASSPKSRKTAAPTSKKCPVKSTQKRDPDKIYPDKIAEKAYDNWVKNGKPRIKPKVSVHLSGKAT